ncbi:CHU large protein; uncharacterized [Pedobacter sp. BAL39]|nr:CHU large protein; uncharacterized [Pedobacter sp. BAL39]
MMMVFVMGSWSAVKGQSRTYANTLGLRDVSGDLSNAVNSTESHVEIIAGAGFAKKYVFLIFPTPVPPNSSVYVKLDNSSSVAATAYTGTTPSTTGTLVATTSKNIMAADGNQFIEINSTSSFNSVRVEVTGNLLGSNTRKLYYAFYNNTNTADCGSGMATATTVDAVLAVGAGVTSPNNAIDASQATSANLTLGTLAVVGVVSETVYFSGPSNTGDAVRTVFSIPSSLLSLGLLNGISVQAYNGGTAIGSPQTLSALLSLDLLGLLGSDAKYTFYFVPGQSFDRVVFTVGGVVSLLGGINLFDVQRVPSPLITNAGPLGDISACGTTTTLSVSTPQSGVTYNWYNVASGGSSLHTGTSYNVTGLTPGTPSTYYVEAVKSGCSNAMRHPVKINPTALPVVAAITGSTSICNGLTTTLSNATAGGVWSSGNAAVATVSASGVVTSVSPGTATISYTVTNSTTGCVNAATASIVVNALPLLSSATTASVCSRTLFSYTTTSNVPGTTFSWSRTAVTGIDNVAVSGNTGQINETLINNTSSPINVTYSLLLNNNGCTTPASLTVTVKPQLVKPNVNITSN